MPDLTAYPDLDPPARPIPDPPTPAPAGTVTAAPDADEAKSGAESAAGKKKKDRDLGRGVETMFRTSYRMHVDLAALADSKANILISINGLIISVMLAAMVPRIGSQVWLFLPTSVVLLTCLASISLAVLAARPRVSRPAAPGGAGAGATGENLMFFGGFLSLSAEAYRAAVAEAIRQPERLYDGMARDIYGLGLVLDRKFRLLRRAYTVFMFGLATGVVLYLVVYLLIGLGEPSAPLSALDLWR